jgi:peptide/nickel transport system substrate-binding protein
MRQVGRTSRSGAVAVTTAMILGGAALAGCASSSSAPSSAGGGPTTTLTIDAGQGTSIQADFNPFQVATLSATAGTDMLYLPLETYNQLTGAYTPSLATGHAVVSATQVDFTLRSGVTWSNGTPVTAADVEYTFGILKKNPALDTSGVWQVLQSVTATGNTVIFKLKVPDSQAAANLAQVPIVPAKVWSAVSNPATFVNADPAVVDGPYELQNFSSVKVVYQKNPKYFGIGQISQAPDTVTGIPEEPGATQVLNLEKGAYDWNEANDDDRGGLASDWTAKDPGKNAYWIPAAGLVTMYLNLDKAPFNDPKFRQALNDGINRQAVAKSANINGYEAAATQTGLLPAQDSLIPAALNGGYASFDPAKARQILLSDGYHYSGSTLIGKNGQPVTFTLQVIQGFVDWLNDAEQITTELSALGISVQVSQVQFSSAISDIYSGEYDAAIYFGDMSSNAYGDYQSMLDSNLSAPIGSPSAGDYERLDSPQADTLLGQIAASTSTATQNAALGGLASYVYNSVPVIELTIQPGWFEYTSKDYTGWPSASDPYADPVAADDQLAIIPQLKATA